MLIVDFLSFSVDFISDFIYVFLSCRIKIWDLAQEMVVTTYNGKKTAWNGCKF